MITDKDITRIVAKVIEAEQEIFVTKTEHQSGLEELRKEFAKLQSSVDGFMGKVETEKTERLAMTSRIDRHERWIKQTAGKVGVELES